MVFSMGYQFTPLGLSAQFAGGGEAPALLPERGLTVSMLNSGASHSDAFGYLSAIMTNAHAGSSFTLQSETINGSNWTYRLTNGNTLTELRTDTYDVFLNTDVSGSPFTSDIFNSGATWRDEAAEAGSEMFVLSLQRVTGLGLEAYADPADVPLSVWQDVATAQVAKQIEWDEVVEFIRAGSTDLAADPVRMVPWTGILARLLQEYIDGDAPAAFEPHWLLGDQRAGVDWWDNHPSGLGRFLMAVAVYAVVWRRDPTLLDPPGDWGVTGPTEGPIALEAVPDAVYVWAYGVIWDYVQVAPLAEVRNWQPDGAFSITTVPGEIRLFRSPEIDPQDPPTSFDVAIRAAGDTGDGTVTTGVTSLPATFAITVSGDYEVRRHPSGQWSPPVTASRVVPEDITLVSSGVLANDGVADSWYEFTLPTGTQAGDFVVMMAAPGATNVDLLADANTKILYPPLLEANNSNDARVGVYRGYVKDPATVLRFNRFAPAPQNIWAYVMRSSDSLAARSSALSVTSSTVTPEAQVPGIVVNEDAAIEWAIATANNAVAPSLDSTRTWAVQSTSFAVGHRYVDAQTLAPFTVGFPGVPDARSLNAARVVAEIAPPEPAVGGTLQHDDDGVTGYTDGDNLLLEGYSIYAGNSTVGSGGAFVSDHTAGAISVDHNINNRLFYWPHSTVLTADQVVEVTLEDWGPNAIGTNKVLGVFGRGTFPAPDRDQTTYRLSGRQTFDIRRDNGGTATTLASYDLGFNLSAGDRLRLRIEGTNPVILTGSIYLASIREWITPAALDGVEDSSADRITATGAAGILTYVNILYGPPDFYFTDLRLWDA